MTDAPPPAALATTLDRELHWLETLIHQRIENHMGQGDSAPGVLTLPEPPELPGRCAYGAAVTINRLSADERLALILALAPWLRPQALDLLFVRNANLDRGFTEFGGRAHGLASGFAPTRQTALFLLAGDALDRRLPAMALFGADGVLVRQRLIVLQPDDFAPWLPLEPHPELLARLLRNPG
ncbi:hypothetical protein K9B35_03685 [Sphingomonas sp. R647]|uniref:hypothetical protein n=1 Tax=Sphingomonas sp. R647 TaxID=2875233 RepID=UPI001CD416CC|nr:hypothetical protein [Sphingomonas sp. R647]MCA1197058.1 hypothetical protein [Sphingomonas sp. R647]